MIAGRLRSNELYVLETAESVPQGEDISASSGESGQTPRGNKMMVRWKQVSSDKMTPAGRQRHTSCVVGTQQLFIFGGFDGHKASRPGSRAVPLPRLAAAWSSPLPARAASEVLALQAAPQ